PPPSLSPPTSASDLFARLLPAVDGFARQGILLGLKEHDFDNNTHLHLKVFVPYTSPTQELVTLLSKHLNHRGQTVLGWYAIPDRAALAHASLPEIAAAYFESVQSALLKAVTADCLRQLRAQDDDDIQVKAFATQIASELCILFSELVGLVVAGDSSSPVPGSPTTTAPISSSFSTVHAFFSSPSQKTISQDIRHNPLQTYLQHISISNKTYHFPLEYDQADAVEAQVLLEIETALLAGVRQEQVARDIEIVRGMSVSAMIGGGSDGDDESWWFSSTSPRSGDCELNKEIEIRRTNGMAETPYAGRDVIESNDGTGEASNKIKPRRASIAVADVSSEQGKVDRNGISADRRQREAKMREKDELGWENGGLEVAAAASPEPTDCAASQRYQSRRPSSSDSSVVAVTSKGKRRSTDLPYDRSTAMALSEHTSETQTIASYRKRIKLEPLASPQALRVTAGQAASSYIRQTLSEDALFYPVDLEDDHLAFPHNAVDIGEITAEGRRRVERTTEAVGRHIE
ncbi:hypothetical protein BC937DRAFT_86301, partial [Endogone sp. FLAS-F59071]